MIIRRLSFRTRFVLIKRIFAVICHRPRLPMLGTITIHGFSNQLERTYLKSEAISLLSVKETFSKVYQPTFVPFKELTRLERITTIGYRLYSEQNS